jgi:hypothetical protein
MLEITDNIKLASKLQCCVIIPTYNNALTLKAVIDDVLQYVADVIVVNDGATDITGSILDLNSVVTVITGERDMPSDRGSDEHQKWDFAMP